MSCQDLKLPLKHCFPLVFRQMLFCRVTLGKSFLQFSTMKMAHAPPGHHSVIGRPSVNGLAYAEYVIYRGEQVCRELVRWAYTVTEHDSTEYGDHIRVKESHLIKFPQHSLIALVVLGQNEDTKILSHQLYTQNPSVTCQPSNSVNKRAAERERCGVSCCASGLLFWINALYPLCPSMAVESSEQCHWVDLLHGCTCHRLVTWVESLYRCSSTYNRVTSH